MVTIQINFLIFSPLDLILYGAQLLSRRKKHLSDLVHSLAIILYVKIHTGTTQVLRLVVHLQLVEADAPGQFVGWLRAFCRARERRGRTGTGASTLVGHASSFQRILFLSLRCLRYYIFSVVTHERCLLLIFVRHGSLPDIGNLKQTGP